MTTDEAARRERSMLEIQEATAGVVGLICALYAWRDALRMNMMRELVEDIGITWRAHERLRELEMRAYSCRSCNASVGAPHDESCVLMNGLT